MIDFCFCSGFYVNFVYIRAWTEEHTSAINIANDLLFVVVFFFFFYLIPTLRAIIQLPFFTKSNTGWTWWTIFDRLLFICVASILYIFWYCMRNFDYTYDNGFRLEHANIQMDHEKIIVGIRAGTEGFLWSLVGIKLCMVFNYE